MMCPRDVCGQMPHGGGAGRDPRTHLRIGSDFGSARHCFFGLDTRFSCDFIVVHGTRLELVRLTAVEPKSLNDVANGSDPSLLSIDHDGGLPGKTGIPQGSPNPTFQALADAVAWCQQRSAVVSFLENDVLIEVLPAAHASGSTLVEAVRKLKKILARRSK